MRNKSKRRKAVSLFAFTFTSRVSVRSVCVVEADLTKSEPQLNYTISSSRKKGGTKTGLKRTRLIWRASCFLYYASLFPTDGVLFHENIILRPICRDVYYPRMRTCISVYMCGFGYGQEKKGEVRKKGNKRIQVIQREK